MAKYSTATVPEHSHGPPFGSAITRETRNGCCAKHSGSPVVQSNSIESPDRVIRPVNGSSSSSGKKDSCHGRISGIRPVSFLSCVQHEETAQHSA